MTDDVRLLQWTLDNVYTIARRELRHGDPRERWGHVLRLCEKAGCQGRGVLRDNGGPMPGAVSDADCAVDPVVGTGQGGLRASSDSSDTTSTLAAVPAQEEAPDWMPTGAELLHHRDLYRRLAETVRALDPAAADDRPLSDWEAAKWAVFNAAVRLVKETNLAPAAPHDVRETTEKHDER